MGVVFPKWKKSHSFPFLKGSIILIAIRLVYDWNLACLGSEANNSGWMVVHNALCTTYTLALQDRRPLSLSLALRQPVW